MALAIGCQAVKLSQVARQERRVLWWWCYLLKMAITEYIRNVDRALLSTVFKNTIRRVNKYLESEGGTLNITCNFLYCNHQVHRDFLITLYRTKAPTVHSEPSKQFAEAHARWSFISMNILKHFVCFCSRFHEFETKLDVRSSCSMSVKKNHNSRAELLVMNRLSTNWLLIISRL